MEKTTTTLKYCLYARKSSESDEQQTMSIDGQLMEMREQAKRQKINVIEEITESHSAKQTGQRPQFNYMLEGISKGKYNAIITWAPDRISRNAGDLGRVIDLMDQSKLLCINTHTQNFSNNPNEKFLLMILCSQAKLENDNRGINVKRGHRNKCQIGIRPGPAPIGYLNMMKSNRIASVVIDPERAEIIKEMFSKVANEGYSGRMIKRWLDKIGYRSKYGNKLALSKIYSALNNPFYYGEFKYGNKWYKGTHEPLITKKLFDRVQIQLEVAPKQWNKQVFPFKKLFRCGYCGANITAEIKYKRLKNGGVNTYIYYHCNKTRDLDCREPYVNEEDLIKQLVALLPDIKLDSNYLWKEFKDEIKRLDHLKNIIENSKKDKVELTQHNTFKNVELSLDDKENSMIKDYLVHILQFGTPEERIKILAGIKSRFELTDKRISLK